MLKGTSNNTGSTQLYDVAKNAYVNRGDEALFLNEYFCNITDRLGISRDQVEIDRMDRDLYNMYGEINGVFDLSTD